MKKVRAVKKVPKDFFDCPKNAVTFPLLRRRKVLAALAARLAQQGFAGHLILFEAGFAPSSSPSRNTILLYKNIAKLAMCRFQRRGHEIQAHGSGRPTYAKLPVPRLLPVLVVRLKGVF